MVDVNSVLFAIKWSGKEYEVSVSNADGTVLCLKKAIELKTGVKVERQKLLNLKHKGWYSPSLYM